MCGPFCHTFEINNCTNKQIEEIIKNKSQIINILQIIKLDKKELYALQHYYFNFNVPIKIVYNKLKCFTF